MARSISEGKSSRPSPKVQGQGVGITFQQVLIGPDQAAQLLATAGRAAETREHQNAVQRYAQIMAAGEWILNAQPIILDETGRLLDGVLRLNAAIAAGVSFQTILAMNVRADTLHTINQHRRRMYQGVLESRGIANAGTIVRMMSKLIRIENGHFTAPDAPISWSHYDRVLDANPALHQAAAMANGLRGSLLHSTARPVLAFMALQAGQSEALSSFFREMGPDHLLGLDSPPRMLALQFQLMRDNGHAYDTDRALALAILAFNDFTAGLPAKGHYQWMPTSDEAAFNRGLPQLLGYAGLPRGGLDTETGLGGAAVIPGAAPASGSGQVTVRMMSVSPAMARRWLQFNQRNRRIQQAHIKAITRDILSGHWMLNAQPISFTAPPDAPEPGKPPRLLNGQHRLYAIAAADVAVEVPVAWNVPEAAFSTYDTHARRSLLPAGASRLDPRVISAAARLQWREDQGLSLAGGRGLSPTASELLATTRLHPGLEEHYARSRRKGLVSLASAGVMTYFIYRVQRENAALAGAFLDQLETGENLVSGNPVLKLRAELTEARGDLRRAEVIHVLLAGWQAYREWAAAG